MARRFFELTKRLGEIPGQGIGFMAVQMLKDKKRKRCLVRVFSLFLTLCFLSVSTATALYAASSQVILKDGRVLTGGMSPVESVSLRPDAKRQGKDAAQPTERIVVIDDGLRQTYVPKYNVQDVLPDDIGASLEIFRLRQPITRSGSQPVASLGSFRMQTPFDEFGRRTIATTAGPLIQGITEITPRYIRVQGINMGIDMRISPHSFKRPVLTALIKKGIDPTSLDDRLRVYQFYVQADLYEEAAEELAEIIADFEKEGENVERLSVGLQMIRQLAAERLIRELEMRADAGQHKMVRSLLETFSEQGVSFEKIQTIRRMIQEAADADAERAGIVERLTACAEKVENAESKEIVETLLAEIKRELNPNSADRFSEFLLSADDQSLTDENRLAVGLTGWMAGNQGVDNRLEFALSMYRVRQLVRKYLLERLPEARDRLWEEIRTEEAATPERLARIFRMMKPPQSTKASSKETPGCYRIEIPSYETGKKFVYFLQLPPEYDPNRAYPLVVTLHSERTTPEMQLDWWCGSWRESNGPDGAIVRERYGQAGRFGAIVLAPLWDDGASVHWDASPEKSAAILYSLRDVCRRFSIDTDKVFLSGHSAGGEATLDLGLAHPDLWAGLIPICAGGSRYPHYLRRNAQFVPIYWVGGELDGGKLARCRTLFDEGMDKYHPFDMTCALFRGRGNESFSDEIIRIFEWMKLRTRNFFPPGERTVFSMRPWDNFFWNVELFDFPPQTMILPIDWSHGGDLPSPYYSARTEFLRTGTNIIRIKTKADRGYIYLAPELVDFSLRMEVYFNGKKLTGASGIVLPSLRVMLDDVRTRADRRHPFWAILDSDRPLKSNEEIIRPENNESENP